LHSQDYWVGRHVITRLNAFAKQTSVSVSFERRISIHSCHAYAIANIDMHCVSREKKTIVHLYTSALNLTMNEPAMEFDYILDDRQLQTCVDAYEF